MRFTQPWADDTEFDYTPLLLRTDPTRRPTALDIDALGELDLAAAMTGTFTGTLPVIAGIWREITPDHTAAREMLAALAGFTEHCTQAGLHTWTAVTPEIVARYVQHPGVSPDARRLAKNSIHAAYLALIEAGLASDDETAAQDPRSPAQGIDPVPGQVRTDQRGRRLGTPAAQRTRHAYERRVHVRAATHDEMLLIRLATRFAGSSRAWHLPGAAVAICSSSATTSEAPQVLWNQHGVDTDGPYLALCGRVAAPTQQETAISARRVPLDDWNNAALTAWRQERTAGQPVAADASILYSGNKPLTDNSAAICADQLIRKVLTIADLRRERGLSAGSLRLWAAARHVTSSDALTNGAAVAGTTPLTLHRQIHQLGDRALHALD